MTIMKRVTPLRIVADVEQAGQTYQDLGMVRQDTDNAGTVGYLAGSTGVILLTSATAAATYGLDIADKMAQSGALYCYVDELPTSLQQTAPLASHSYGEMTEQVFATDAGLMVMATRSAA